MSFDAIVLDDASLFEKQTFRNRTLILGANKVLPLIVPVKRGRSKIPVSVIEIDYSTNWQKDHWISIESAYNKSPYFFYYQDYLKPFFTAKYAGLFELDLEIIKSLLDLLQINTQVELLSDHKEGEDLQDFRNCIHPKPRHYKEDAGFKTTSYIQVFSDRFDFVPNLSILDLLFNMGPESLTVLKNSLA